MPSPFKVDELKYFDKIEFENGERYEGAWRGDTMNGKGTYCNDRRLLDPFATHSPLVPHCPKGILAL